jgi:zinc protease
LNTAKEAWEPYALDVLAGVLDGGDSARFAKELIRGKQIASSVNAGYDMTSRKEDLFTLNGTPARGHKINEIEDALKAQVKRIHDTPVEEAELARIKAQVIAANVYGRDSVFYQAMQIGTLETVGLSWKLLDEYVDKIQAVTPEQVQQVARKYLIDDNLTVAILQPLPLGDRPKPPPAIGGGHDF